MIKNYDESVEINHYTNLPYISDYPYGILITGGSESGKANVLLNFKKSKIYWIKEKRKE